MKKSLLFIFTCLFLLENNFSQVYIPATQITTTDSVLCFGDTTTLHFPAITADSSSLLTPIINNNGQDGNMFDITATNTIRIRYFQGNIANTPNATTEYYIYYKTGTHVGFETNPAAWTLIAGPVNFNPNIPNVLSLIPVNINLTIPAGQTYAFYLTNTAAISNNNRYHNGTFTGNVSASNTDLTVYEGPAVAYPFGIVFIARPWEGNIIYDYPVISYLWNTGDTTSSIQVSPGANTGYSCVASIPSSTIQDNISIQVNMLPVVSWGNDTAICPGNILTLDAGNPGSTYAWCNGDTSQTIPVTSTGIQCVTITDINGCIGIDSIDVTIYPQPMVTGNANIPILCAGDSVTLTGTGAVSYSWNNGITNGIGFVPDSSSYIVTGIDSNACSGMDTLHLNIFPLPNVVANATDDSICQGDFTTLFGSGAVSYTWNNGIINGSSFPPIFSGLFTVTGTDTNTCTNTDTIYITVNSLPLVNLGANIVQPNPPAILDAGPGFSEYTWSTSGNTQTISVNTNGTYWVVATDANGCTGSDTIQVNFTSGIFNPDGSITHISLYPNPSTDFINLHIQDLQTDDMTIEVIDSKGSMILAFASQSVAGNFNQVISVQELRSGMYILQVKTNNYISQIRFIKR